MKCWRLAALLTLFGLVISQGTGQVWAHQQKEAITTVLFNTSTGNIEIMHRFLLHDAEHAVKLLRKSPANIIDSADDRVWFAEYVSQRFSLRGGDQDSLPLRLVGQEIEGRFLWVYQETSTPENIAELTISHDALRDIWPGQVNLVNVERGGMIKSVVFTGGVQALVVGLVNPD